tara:strand:- start:59943 stop:62255 length:2313 start_codon:yes stop_codon:yes gene_type:complete
MFCEKCQIENHEQNNYCTNCGRRLLKNKTSTADLDGLEKNSKPMNSINRIINLERQVKSLRLILARNGMSIEEKDYIREFPPPTTDPSKNIKDISQSKLEKSDNLIESYKKRFNNIFDLELILGGNWLARIGVIAVLIGTAFFLKLAIDNKWIDETGQVTLGILTGLIFIGLGEYFYRSYTKYAQTLFGGGIGILYISVFAAFAIHSMFGLYITVGMVFLITFTASLLALKHDSASLATIGIIGAFLAPFIISAGNSSLISPGSSNYNNLKSQFLFYVILLDLGVLFLSTFKNWSWFNKIALVFSMFAFVFWYIEFSKITTFWEAQVYLSIIFAIFIFVGLLFHMIWKRVPGISDYSTMLANGIFYLIISNWIFRDSDFKNWLGSFTLLIAVIYSCIGYYAFRVNKSNSKLSLMYFGISLLFITIAFPIQLEGAWLGVAWSIEGALVIWLSFVLKSWEFRISGYFILALTFIWMIFYRTPTLLNLKITPIWNVYTIEYILVIASILVSGWIIKNSSNYILDREKILEEYGRGLGLHSVFFSCANLLFAVGIFIQLENSWIIFTWSIFNLLLIFASFRFSLIELRWFSYLLFGISIINLISLDIVNSNNESIQFILNYRFLAFISIIVSLYGSAYLIFSNKLNILDRFEIRYILLAILVITNLLTLIMFSLEILDYIKDTKLSSLGVSIFWAIYAGIILFIGVIREFRLVRIGGLIILAVPVAKLFLYDVFSLDQIYRVSAFLILGAILIIGGLMYQKYSKLIKGFLFENK